MNIRYDFKKFNIFYTNDIAGEKEIATIKEYAELGWTILNQNKGGGLGGTERKWTSIELCNIEAKRFASKTEWSEKSSGSYHAALKNGWLEQCCDHMQQLQLPKNYWTLDRCKEIAKSHKSIREWSIKSAGSYRKAFKNGWIKICMGHMEKYKNWKDINGLNG